MIFLKLRTHVDKTGYLHSLIYAFPWNLTNMTFNSIFKNIKSYVPIKRNGKIKD